ncbi:MAG: hypothetical protein DMF51_09690 [Acidobacteria bacterium]|nr:MAG: hypothetical protein DMF51_09690 [Acidobacteriota bacterium]
MRQSSSLPAPIVHNRSTRTGMSLAALLMIGVRVTSGAAAGVIEELQRAIAGALKGHQGCAVVLDVESDRLLAWSDLDLAARRLVPPGSTLKPFTLLALLEAGAVKADTPFVCGRDLKIAGRRMDCTHVATPEPLDAATALAYSCNNYFAHFAGEISGETLLHAFERAGLTARTGLARGEGIGVVLPVNDLEQQRLQALGEARIKVTPLGLAEAYRRLARGRADGGPRQVLLAPLYAGLEASTSFGVGRRAAPSGLAVAGKTGTAAASEGPWTHAWFAGYAPAERPEVVLVVFLERGQGGADAAPVARQIFAAWAAWRERS